MDKQVTRTDILDKLTESFQTMSPQLRKAARYILDHPNDVGVNSIHQLAAAAEVHPNTLVRIANILGYKGYRELRRPFSESLRKGSQTFPDRARWLQSIAQGQRYGHLFSQLAATNIAAIEQLFSGTSPDEIKTAADWIVGSRRTYVLGVGTSHSLAHNFWYVTHMAFNNIILVPGLGSVPIDDIANIGPKDVLLAITFHPYRADVVVATRHAKKRGAKVVSITDSRASPIATVANSAFIAPNTSPQFYVSLVATQAIIEAIIAFMVADADGSVIQDIEQFHRLRYESGVYTDD